MASSSGTGFRLYDERTRGEGTGRRTTRAPPPRAAPARFGRAVGVSSPPCLAVEPFLVGRAGERRSGAGEQPAARVHGAVGIGGVGEPLDPHRLAVTRREQAGDV